MKKWIVNRLDLAELMIFGFFSMFFAAASTIFSTLASIIIGDIDIAIVLTLAGYSCISTWIFINYYVRSNASNPKESRFHKGVVDQSAKYRLSFVTFLWIFGMSVMWFSNVIETYYSFPLMVILFLIGYLGIALEYKEDDNN